jgi:hypothetical protein
MDQPARMWKTLACLVAAMTGTAAFLGWLDPSQPPVSNTLPYGELIRLARSAVADGVEIHGGQWREVEIGADSVAAGRPLLSATVDGGEWHFFVGPDGRPVRGDRWRDQRAPAGSPHTVRIQVSRPPDGERISPAQWRCVRALVAVLSEAVSTDVPSLPVRLGEGWAKTYGVERGSVFRLVHTELTSS